jgi:hypothetical protein
MNACWASMILFGRCGFILLARDLVMILYIMLQRLMGLKSWGCEQCNFFWNETNASFIQLLGKVAIVIEILYQSGYVISNLVPLCFVNGYIQTVRSWRDAPNLLFVWNKIRIFNFDSSCLKNMKILRWRCGCRRRKNILEIVYKAMSYFFRI